MRRKLLRDHRLDHDFSPFTTELVKDIKESSNSTSTYLDVLNLLHLKLLGPVSIQASTKIFKLSIVSR